MHEKLNDAMNAMANLHEVFFPFKVFGRCGHRAVSCPALLHTGPRRLWSPMSHRVSCFGCRGLCELVGVVFSFFPVIRRARCPFIRIPCVSCVYV